MNRENIIVITKEGVPIGCFGSLTEICEVYNLPYGSLKAKKFPLESRGLKLYKMPFRVPQGDEN